MSDPKVTKKSYRVYQVIDLSNEFGVDFGRNREAKERISQALIDSMKDRIAKGRDLNNRPMAPYSKEYKKSDEFIAARKGSTVNMFLSGDMLGAIDVLSIKGNKVTFGFNDREQELKAHGHMSGNVGKVREFFGVSDMEINKVENKMASLLDSLKPKEQPK